MSICASPFRSPIYRTILNPLAPIEARLASSQPYIFVGSDGNLAGLPTTARTTDLWLPDASGVYQQYGNGEVGIINGDAVWSQPAQTNLATRSVDLSAFFSTVYVVTENSTTETSFDGTNTATEIEDDSADAERCQQNMQAAQGIVFDDSRTYTWTVWYKKTTGHTHYAFQQCRFGTASDVFEGVIIDTNTGTVVAERDTDGSYEVEDVGDYFRVSLSLTDNDSGNTLFIVSIYPAYNTNGGVTQDSAATGAKTIGAIQVNEGPFYSYIPTAGSAVTINATEPKFTTVNPTTNFSGSFRWKPAAASQGTIWLLGNYTDASNGWGVLHDGTNVIFRNRVSGSNNDAVKALSYSADTEYLIHFKHDTELGLDVAVDRVAGTNDPTTTAVTNAANTYIGQDGNDASHMTGSMRDIRIQKHAIGWSDSEWLAT